MTRSPAKAATDFVAEVTRLSKYDEPPAMSPVDCCPLCGALDRQFLFRGPDRLHGTPGEFTYVRCKSCRTVYQDPRVLPEELGRCYPKDYYTHRDARACAEGQSCPENRPAAGLRDSIRQSVVSAVRGRPEPGFVGLCGKMLALSRRVRERAFFNSVPDILLPHGRESRRALDVGCGSGQLVESLIRAGWDVDGVDWDANAFSMGKLKAAGNLWQGDFRYVEIPCESYDLITMRHVIEHIDDTVSALERIKALLRPGGRAVLFYPNPESLGAKLYREMWFAWDAPRHLVLPPLQVLASAAEKLGLQALTTETSAKEAAYLFAKSRIYEAGGTPARSEPQPIARERLIGVAEALMVRLGFAIGEEVRIVLRKPDSGD